MMINTSKKQLAGREFMPFQAIYVKVIDINLHVRP